MKKDLYKTDLLRKFSHDLLNIFGNIKNLNELLYEASHDKSENVKIIKLIDLQSKQGLEIVKSILQPLEKTNISLNTFLQNLVNVYNYKASLKRVKVLFTPAESDVVLCTNKAAFFRLLSNIVENAIKYSPENTNVSLFIQTLKEKDLITITVKDNGIGIDSSLLSKLFETKHTQKIIRNGTEKEVSHGLGLQISKEICDNLGFGLHVKSKLNEGSSFCISIPFHHLTYPSKTEVSL